MPIQQCEIDIPEGMEIKKVERIVECVKEETSLGDGFLLIHLRPVRPKLAVGDWVRVEKPKDFHDGTVAKVLSVNARGDCLVALNGDGNCWFSPEWLTKQTRTITPYTIDQCIEAAARLKTRHIRCKNEMATIESFHVAGVTASLPWVGFTSYVEAAKSFEWDGGEAFGTEGWEDAK